jgi:hypothetical protein
MSYRKIYQGGQNDAGLLIDPDTGTCTIGSSCTGPAVHGGYNVKEVYGELFVPVLKDLPFVHSLNVTLGDRYSKYSDFGSTNNWKVGVEFRPTRTCCCAAPSRPCFARRPCRTCS